MTAALFLEKKFFLMLALDHRQSFKKILSPQNYHLLTQEEIISEKAKIIKVLLPKISGLLIDVEYGLPAYKLVDPSLSKPFLLPVEESGFLEDAGERFTKIQYSVFELKKLGASGIKLLLYFNPFLKSARHQLELAKKVLLECKSFDLPLFLEIVTYQHEKTLERKENFVIESVKRFLAESIYPTVFKLEYPGSSDTCWQLTSILKHIPWILLTRGDSFEAFKHKLYFAVKNGASGFLAGRALWQDIVSKKGKEKEEMLTKVLPKRFEEIKQIVWQK